MPTNSEHSFTGRVKKLQIVSNNICYGHCPEPDDEVEQHLSITADGIVFFSAYIYGDGDKYTKSRSKNFKIDTAKAAFILNVVGNHFSREQDVSFATDVGNWEMSLTNDENKMYHFRGPLFFDRLSDFDSISDSIRFTLEIPGLLVFDGRSNSDRIERISVDYHRAKKIKPGVRREGATWECAIWDYSEHLKIDRKTETLEHMQNFGRGCQVSRKYYVEDGITSFFLDNLDAETFFTHTKGGPPDDLYDPLGAKEYRIAIDYLFGGQRVLTGSFDKNGLPDDFAIFAKDVFDFMQYYGMGEMLGPSVRDKPLRKQSDLIFCNVQFDAYGKTYCYLTDDDTLVAKDYVIVPVGKENRESIAKIESIEYHPAEEAPFPLEKIKKIIRKADNTKNTDDTIALPADTVVMESEPLAGISANAWRAMFGENRTDEALAAALAGAWNESEWLECELDDDDCTPEIEAAYEAWCALKQELIERVALRLKGECKPLYAKLITPFMVQNGYHNRCGWWVKQEKNDTES